MSKHCLPCLQLFDLIPHFGSVVSILLDQLLVLKGEGWG